MDIIYLVIGILVGFTSGYFIFKFRSANSSVKIEERNSILKDELDKKEKELNSLREEYLKISNDLSSIKADYKNLEEKLTDQGTEFKNIVDEILKEKSKEFTDQNKTNLQQILEPLKEKIKDFEKKVEDSNKESIDRFAGLRQQLGMLKDLNQQMSLDAQNLTKALKGDSKTQGDWGEIQLERILERSGLRKGEEYSAQESFTTNDGRKRPDVIINLPEDKKIIIDSKVSLTHYERFVSAENEEEQNLNLKSFIESVKKHIKDLSSKEYQNLFESGSPDFVLMFIPIERAFGLAVQFGENIYVDAFDKNIVIVSPTTLLATLRTIASIWKQEHQNRNVKEIAKQSGRLYDKFVGFVQDLTDIGNRLDQAKSSFDNAKKKLSEGTGNLIIRANKIKELGANTTKTLPSSLDNLIDSDDEDNTEE